MCADGIEEVAVVRNDKHRVLEVGKIILQPSHSLKVEVVGRLVKKEVVGISEECLCKKHAHFFICTHILHEHIMAVFFDSETRKEGSSIALGIPAFEFGETFLEFGSTDTVGIGEILLGIDGILLLHYVPKHGVTAKHCLDNGAFIKLEVILA